MKILFVVICIASLSGCRQKTKAASEKQIFAKQQRSRIEPSTATFVGLVADNGGVCTFFILDPIKRIGMTASHCNVHPATTLCFATKEAAPVSNDYSKCVYPATLDNVIEESPENGLDYVVFHYSYKIPNPPLATGIKLANRNELATLLTKKAAISMIGYPGDRYQNLALTASRCLVRDSNIVSDDENFNSEDFKSFIDPLVEAWEKDPKYHNHQDYQAMRTACWFISKSPPKNIRPAFKTDCSVYGGNSGGPVFVDQTKAVIGMPASYYPEPVKGEDSSSFDPCYGPYWDTFFKPIAGDQTKDDDTDTAKSRAKWNKLNRRSTDLSDFPTAIPAHLIVQGSAFFKQNPQYTTSEIYKESNSSARR